MNLINGRKYKAGCITEGDGNIIDLSTVEKLYKYLVEQENVRMSELTKTLDNTIET